MDNSVAVTELLIKFGADVNAEDIVSFPHSDISYFTTFYRRIV